ncbi:hypothetical protein JJQ72_19650, partial [Paenibacillus sp. F411]|uniref:hypothetical protein n=1 Tax=Paenibacillus sp. F411 TaxID=2820239 RepID=UPI001AAFFE6F
SGLHLTSSKSRRESAPSRKGPHLKRRSPSIGSAPNFQQIPKGERSKQEGISPKHHSPSIGSAPNFQQIPKGERSKQEGTLSQAPQPLHRVCTQLPANPEGRALQAGRYLISSATAPPSGLHPTSSKSRRESAPSRKVPYRKHHSPSIGSAPS